MALEQLVTLHLAIVGPGGGYRNDCAPTVAPMHVHPATGMLATRWLHAPAMVRVVGFAAEASQCEIVKPWTPRLGALALGLFPVVSDGEDFFTVDAPVRSVTRTDGDVTRTYGRVV